LLWLVLGSLAACSGGGGGGGATAVLNPPTASNGAVSTLEDSTVNATLSASDPNGNALTFRVITNPGKGTVVVNATTGSFSYTPNLNANGGDSFTFVANNGGSDSNVATVSITITPLSDPPVAVNDTYTAVPAGQLYTVTANCADQNPNKRGVLCNDTDPDGAAPTQAFIASPQSHGTLTLNTNGSFTYTHNGTSWNMCGSLRCDSFTYFANDGTLNSNTPATVTLYIDLSPVANNGCSYTSLNQALTGTLSASDPEGNSVSYSIFESPTKGSVMITDPLTGAFSYQPFQNARGTDSFKFRASDGLSLSNIAAYNVVYTPRIMPLGDSITDGDTNGGPPVPQRVGYRKPLKDALTAAGYLTDFVGTQNSGSSLFSDPEHEGYGGFTADELNNGKGTVPNLTTRLNDTRGQPDVVLLHVGTNDLSAGGDQSNQWPDIETILTTIDNWESSNWPVTVVVARIIKRNESESETNTFNNNVINLVVNPRLSGSDRIIWVDQESALTPFTVDYADNLHPSTNGYQKMADVWLFPLAGAGFGTSTGSHPPAGAGILPKCP
jgi:VCBS repeat-containing protein